MNEITLQILCRKVFAIHLLSLLLHLCNAMLANSGDITNQYIYRPF